MCRDADRAIGILHYLANKTRDEVAAELASTYFERLESAIKDGSPLPCVLQDLLAADAAAAAVLVVKIRTVGRWSRQADA